jgi:YD repeat-containing protein
LELRHRSIDLLIANFDLVLARDLYLAMTENALHCETVATKFEQIGSNPAPESVPASTFGNLNKDGTVSFLVAYDTTTNRIGSGQGFCYDTNGNTTQDNEHAYAWDAEGRPVTIDAIGLTYCIPGCRWLTRRR